MFRKYKLPIQGKVLNDDPLTGDENNPVVVIPLNELMPKITVTTPDGSQIEVGKFGSYQYTCLEYNVDEEWAMVELEATPEFHDWLLSLLPQMKSIQNQRGWRLNKIEMEKARLARQG